MKGKLCLAHIMMTAGMLLIFTMIVGMGSTATGAQLPVNFTVNQITESVEQTSPPIRLAQFTNPPAGTMLGGVGIFAPPGLLHSPGVSGGMYFVPDADRGVPVAPMPAPSPYRRCPYGGFDCDL